MIESAQLFKALLEEELSLEQQIDSLTQLSPESLTPKEIFQCARVSMECAELIPGISNIAVDIVGTGGDGLNTFNISTTAAFVAAGAGIKIAKNGAGSANSLSSSLGLLEALNIDIKETPEGVVKQLENCGLTFIMQPYFHPKALKVRAARAELAKQNKKTIFNILGPLVNPARLTRKALGVFSLELIDVYAEILNLQGVKKAMVFHGDGMDELSLAGPNHIAIINHGKIEKMELSASDTCLPACSLDDLIGGHPKENADMAKAILNCDLVGPKRNAVILNAAAAIFVGYPENISLFDAIYLAQESIDSGAALKSLNLVQKKNN